MSALALERLVRPNVLVLGDVPEIDAAVPAGTRVLRVTLDGLAATNVPVALAVLDARSHPVHLLARARSSPRLADAPALLVADTDLSADAVGADDALMAPLDRAAARRIHTLIELGRARLSFGYAQRAIESSLPPQGKGAVNGRTFDRAILDEVDVGIITTDLGGRVRFANDCARDILRCAGDLEGTDVRHLLALQRDPAAFVERPDRRWAHSLRVEGTDIEIDLTVSRVEAAAFEDLGFVFIFHDRTQEKQLEMERRRFERLAAMGTMVAGFAHEVRNPMASLRSLAESLNEELAEANVNLPHVGRMLVVLERVERLVRTSLLFGRPSPPRLSAHRPWTVLSAAVSAVLPRTRELGGDLNVDTEGTLPDVYVDDGQMVQALVILLNNALDATGSPRRVLLRATQDRSSSDGRGRRSEPPSRYVRFDVKDDGRGIPPDILGRIFDPFFTTKATGTGLGLSIAQQLVTENGARIEVVSQVGGPTTFSLLVPVVGGDGAPISRR